MFHESFRTLFWRELKSTKQGAEYFHVPKPTITRWLDGTVPINPLAEKLMLINRLVTRLTIYVGLPLVSVRNAPSSLRRLAVRSALRNWKALCSGVMSIVSLLKSLST